MRLKYIYTPRPELHRLLMNPFVIIIYFFFLEIWFFDIVSEFIGFRGERAEHLVPNETLKPFLL